MADNLLNLSVSVESVLAAWVFAAGCAVEASSPELSREIAETTGEAMARSETPARLEVKASVRKMLRHGAYHPSGRGKPASEYLLSAAVKTDFPLINNLVDIINLVSLRYLLPVSLVDVERAGTHDFLLRRGREGESYVFNASGQVLSLRDLLLLARLPGDAPCATPVKDSHATKVHGGSRSVLGVIYAPEPYGDEAREAAALMAGMLSRWGGAVSCEWGLEASGSSPDS